MAMTFFTRGLQSLLPPGHLKLPSGVCLRGHSACQQEGWILDTSILLDITTYKFSHLLEQQLPSLGEPVTSPGRLGGKEGTLVSGSETGVVEVQQVQLEMKSLHRGENMDPVCGSSGNGCILIFRFYKFH